MFFGMDLRKKKKKKAKETPEQIKAREDEHKLGQRNEAITRANESKAERQASYGEGRQRAMDLFNDPSIKGLSDEKRNALQYEANKQIQRQHQSADRKLLGSQGQHGIVGKGGVGYAQRRDLQGLANESYGQVNRDLDKLNEDQRMKQIAAIFAGEQGEAAQYQLDKQLALDELKLDEERKRQRAFEDKFDKLFSRI